MVNVPPLVFVLVIAEAPFTIGYYCNYNLRVVIALVVRSHDNAQPGHFCRACVNKQLELRVEGLDVYYSSHLPAFASATAGQTAVIVGDFGEGALANFPNGDEIKIKFDDLSESEKDLIKIVGREYVALEVVSPKAFVKVNKQA